VTAAEIAAILSGVNLLGLVVALAKISFWAGRLDERVSAMERKCYGRQPSENCAGGD